MKQIDRPIQKIQPIRKDQEIRRIRESQMLTSICSQQRQAEKEQVLIEFSAGDRQTSDTHHHQYHERNCIAAVACFWRIARALIWFQLDETSAGEDVGFTTELTGEESAVSGLSGIGCVDENGCIGFCLFKSQTRTSSHIQIQRKIKQFIAVCISFFFVDNCYGFAYVNVACRCRFCVPCSIQENVDGAKTVLNVYFDLRFAVQYHWKGADKKIHDDNTINEPKYDLTLNDVVNLSDNKAPNTDATPDNPWYLFNGLLSVSVFSALNTYTLLVVTCFDESLSSSVKLLKLIWSPTLAGTVFTVPSSL